MQEVHRCNSEHRPVQLTTLTGAAAAPHASKKASKKAPSAGAVRKRDLIFEAVASQCGISGTLTPSARGFLNRAVKELKEAGATPEKIAIAGRNWPTHFPDAVLTPMALSKHWPTLHRRRESSGNGRSRSRRDGAIADIAGYRAAGEDELADQLEAQVAAGDFDTATAIDPPRTW